MARSYHGASLELDRHRRPTQLAGGLGRGVLAQAGWDADERVDGAPGPEWSAAERQTVLSRWHCGQPVRSDDAAAVIDDQGTSDKKLDFLR